MEKFKITNENWEPENNYHYIVLDGEVLASHEYFSGLVDFKHGVKLTLIRMGHRFTESTKLEMTEDGTQYFLHIIETK